MSSDFSPSSPTVSMAESIDENACLTASPSSPKTISLPVIKYGPRTPSQSTTPSSHMRSLSDIIGEKFPPFDHETNIVSPFNNEVSRDSEFEKELASMLLDAIMETHAWAAARPKHESSLAAQNIEKKIVSVINTENEQGMSLSRPQLTSRLFARVVDKTRQQLNQFVIQMKTALSALTGLAGL